MSSATTSKPAEANDGVVCVPPRKRQALVTYDALHVYIHRHMIRVIVIPPDTPVPLKMDFHDDGDGVEFIEAAVYRILKYYEQPSFKVGHFRAVTAEQKIRDVEKRFYDVFTHQAYVMDLHTPLKMGTISMVASPDTRMMARFIGEFNQVPFETVQLELVYD